MHLWAMAELTARWHRAISELPEEQWQGLLAAAAAASGPEAPPFFSWRWLHHLEASGSIAPREGWQPCHLSFWRGEQLVALAPLYLKGHSFGEFVFDQSFAQLAGQLGLRYYPKLVGMSPLSPAEGYRFWFAPQEDAAALTALMLEQIEAFCRANRILSCNFLRERRSVAKAGLTVTPLAGADIPPALVRRMHHFYAQHCARWGPWGSKYLTEAFFTAAAAELRDALVLFSAHRGDPADPVAMSLCVHDRQQLWGRYWGSDVDLDNLHFEVCYYAPIEWAIQRGIAAFDPGAGGSHKRRRGFLAQPRASLHRWLDPQFDGILRDWLPGANRQMLGEIEAINADVPFTAAYDPPHVPDPYGQRSAAAG